MIKFEERFEKYAYRVADDYVDDSVTELEEGQWVTYNTDGKLIVSDGTKKSFIALGSKRAGRNLVGGVSVKKISYLHGPFRLKVSNFDPAGNYDAPMTPLKVTTGGVLTPWVKASDSPEMIHAYSKCAPVDGYLVIYSA